MHDPFQPGSDIHKRISHYYEPGQEGSRLSAGLNRLEFWRTQELLVRFLPQPPATILDIGGGTGVYAFWLAQLGYQVHLVDLMPTHIEQARQFQQSNSTPALASLTVGDARNLDWPDNSIDATLFLGPLYHLTERPDRIKAWQEARRVTRPGGVVAAAVITRFASMLDGMFRGLLADPLFVELMQQDLNDGQHRNPLNRPGYFTTAYFHHPHEIKAEVEEAGLKLDSLLAIEGPAGFSSFVADKLDSPEFRELILAICRKIEAEPSLLGASGHLFVLARKTGAEHEDS